MATSSFTNWQLSSSDSEDENATKGILLNIKNKRKSKENPTIDLDISEEKYIPLFERLKGKGSESTDSSDDDLPSFNFKKPAPVSNKENIELDNQRQESPFKKKSDEPVIDISDDPFPKSKAPAKSRRRSLRLHAKESDGECDSSTESQGIDKPVKNDGAVRKKAANQVKKDEAERRKALNSHLKTLKPEECMKYMECRISSLIVFMFPDIDFSKQLQDDFDPTCIVESFEIPCVRWRRKVDLTPSEVKDQTSKFHDEPEMLVVLPADEFVKLAHVYLTAGHDEDTLTDWVRGLQHKNPGVNIHLVCHGLERYTKDLKSKQPKKKRRSYTPLPELSPKQIEEVLVDLQIECKTTVLYTEKGDEVINMIKQLTKSIGEAPYKRMKRQDVQFINEIPSVKINPKTREGLKKAWGQMIRQFHNVTPVMASAITDRYPTLLSLVKAYESCGNDTPKAERLLADIPVRRGVGTLQTSRRIGPELSYKIYKLVTSKDPDERLY